MKHFIILLSSLFVLAACNSNNPQTQINTSASDSIIGGSKVASYDLVARSTVAIHEQGLNGGGCTGTLIDKNLVLTAAHCLEGSPKNMFIVFHTDLWDAVNAREPDFRDQVIRPVAEYVVHPKWKTTPEDQEYDLYDIALIRFSGSIPEGFQPVEYLKDHNQLRKFQNLIVAGYGVTSVKMEFIDPATYPNLQVALMTGEVLCFETPLEAKQCIKIIMDGDDVLRQASAPMRDIHQTEFSLDESKGQGTCSGDSGGPAYVKLANRLIVVGVTSRGTLLCNEEGVYTSTGAYAFWIESQRQLLNSRVSKTK